MQDLAKIKRNVVLMANQGAPTEDIDGYIASEGVTIDDVRNFKLPPSNTTITQPTIYSQPSDIFPKQGNAGVDAVMGALSGVAKLPLGAMQLATAGLQTLAGQTAKIPGTNISLEDIASKERQVAQDLSQIQTLAAQRSPIVANLANMAPQLGQLAPVGASLTGPVGIARAGAAGGVLSGLLEPSQETQAPTELLSKRAENAAVSGLTNALLAPTIYGAAKLPRVLGNTKNAVVNKLLKIDPSATKLFEDVNIQPTLAAVSNNPTVKMIDQWLSKFPTAVGVMEKNTNRILDDVNNLVQNAGASKAVTPQEAGAIIKSGVTQYVRNFQNVADLLYKKLDNFIPPQTSVGTQNAQTLLQKELTGLTPGLLERVQQNQGVKILQDIVSDSESGVIPYEILKRYRTELGGLLSKPQLLSGTDESILRRAYGALSEDMKQAAIQAGPSAVSAFNRANKYYSIGADNIKKNLDSIANKIAPEEVYRAAISGTKLGGTRIGKVLNALDPSQKEIVAGTVLNRASLDKNNNFSLGQFTSSWTNPNTGLSREAKQVLFDRQTRESLDKIAQVGLRMRDITRFSNPSGTASTLTLGALLLGGGYGAGMGHPGLSIGLTGGALLSGYTGARLMNNKDFINWLGKNVTAPLASSTIDRSFQELRKVAAKNPDISKEVAKYSTLLYTLYNKETAKQE